MLQAYWFLTMLAPEQSPPTGDTSQYARLRNKPKRPIYISYGNPNRKLVPGTTKEAHVHLLLQQEALVHLLL